MDGGATFRQLISSYLNSSRNDLANCLIHFSDLMHDRGQWVIIIDLEDYSVRMACSGNLRYCKSIADIDAKHYPERYFTCTRLTRS
jgi:hypothetical protein